MQSLIQSFLKKQGIDSVGFLNIEDLHIFQSHRMPENIGGAAVWLIPYYTGAHPNRNISLYSVSKDYHTFSDMLGKALITELQSAFPNESFYCFCDSSPVNEVQMAVSAGLGVIGKNRLLIHKTYGSYVFIGACLTTARFDNAKKKPAETCLGCGKCISACEFLAGKSDVCISELNQQKNITDDQLALVRSKRIRWGCDICQEVCPMNKNVPLTPIPFFYEDTIEKLTPALVETMTKEAFHERAYAWRGKKTILRNITDG